MSMGVKLPGDIIVHLGGAFIIIPDLHEDCPDLNELMVVNSNNGNKEKKNHWTATKEWHIYIYVCSVLNFKDK